MVLRILNSITRTKAEELFARERMGDGTAAATGAQEPERRQWRWQSGGQEPRWLGANVLLGDAAAMSSRHPVHSTELLRVDYRLGLGQRRPRRQHHGRPWQAIHPPQPPFAAAAHQRLPARKPHIRPLRHQRRGGKSRGVRRAPSPPIIIIPALLVMTG
uniref:Uncharacterized protein n=1 Tax=Oryza sativa subsp. japonica TaxID=39947 RepID=Q6YZ12_ORYSJ|nr:hypothetical protein [Oryza sativa Japonica Group]BAD13176.1 hypothetical protein [Oryza sativa Japonica Group]